MSLDDFARGEGSGCVERHHEDGTTTYEETRVPLYPAPPPPDKSRRKAKIKPTVPEIPHVADDINFDTINEFDTGDEPTQRTRRKVRKI